MTKSIAACLSFVFMASAALPALAADPTPTPKPPKTINVACIQAAIEKRDTAVVSAYDTLHTSIVSALNARKQALKDAWAKTDRLERRTALKSAWSTYHQSRMGAQKTWRTARRDVWKTFRTDAKACGPTTTVDGMNEGADASL